MIYVRRDPSIIPKELLEEAAAAQKVLETLPAEQRRFYIKRKSSLWRKFGKYLEKMSYGKCWYSESPDPQSFFDVDHFRPKSEARRSKEEVDVPGYEWLAFSWENFRYAATRSNRVSRGEKAKLEGKGSWFPLLNGTKASWVDRCEQREKPMLLDPVRKADVRLIDVAEDGRIVPSRFAVGLSEERVRRSCELYGLNLPGIREARRRLIREVTELISFFQGDLLAAKCPGMPLAAIEHMSFEEKLDYLDRKTWPSSPYTRTVRVTLRRLGYGDICQTPEESE